MLILNAVNDRNLRIEVGYGLEHVLTDIGTSNIRKDYMNPYLAEGDYDTGLYTGYIAVVEKILSEYNVELDGIEDYVKSESPSVYPYPSNQDINRSPRRINFAPILFIIFLAFDGIVFKFKITSTILKILFWASFYGGGRGGRGGPWGGGRGGFGGGGFGGGGRSGGGGSSGRY